MSNKKIYKYEDILPRIYAAVDLITDPIASTLSPKGNNVIYEDANGDQYVTNDGYTIATNILVSGDVENAIIEIIKEGSRKTNLEAGDGTSSTIVMSSILIKEGLRLVENGHNQMEVRDNMNKFALDMKKELSKRVTKIKDDKDIKFIAKVSANNDEEIANNVVKIIKVVGEDGQVILDRGFTPDTEIIEDTGFVIKSGVFAKELSNKQFQTGAIDSPILITDKRIYYKSEAETILQTVLDAGYDEVTIIAQDFIGEALPYFVTNHTNGKIKVILVMEKNLDILEDLAIYLGTDVISDKKGSIVDNIKIADFALAKRVFSDPAKTIISRDKTEGTKEIDKRVKSLKREMKKIGNKQDSEFKKLAQRVSSLTTGMVTLKVGGSTPLEIMEKLHRYEDSINASRVALREGYLPGAGVAVYNAFKNVKVESDYIRMFTKATQVNIRQIALNCGKTPELILNAIDDVTTHRFTNQGYNAVTDKIEDIVKAGIIEPFIVTSQVIANAVSIANVIITSKYLIVNEIEEENKNG